jgi:MFS transporter, DHA1 family, multidrug resistance protein
MTTPAASTVSGRHAPLGQREFIVLIAALMSLQALGVDAMLPALPAIGKSLHVVGENTTQWVIASYVFGFGAMQLVYGPLADRYGRRPVLIATMVGFVIASVIASVAATFPLLLAARVLQGTMSASTRVLTTSIVRDCYTGRTMARIMSLSQMLFFIVPILAPTVGSAILLFGPWRWIFWFLVVFAIVVASWAAIRLPETLKPEQRREISFALLTSAWAQTLTNRFSLGYALASTAMFGAILGYVNSSQQLFADVFKRPDIFPLAFAITAGAMGVMTFANAQLVERFGTRRLSHTALLALIAISAFHLAVEVAGYQTLTNYLVLQALTMACFGLTGSNFSAMAMEPVGHIAGTASSVQGFLSTVGGAIIGIIIGQAFDGTTLPVTIGFLVVATAALLIVFITEGGQLFTARNATP